MAIPERVETDINQNISQWCKEQTEMFDVLYNNTASNQAPKLDDYEKSVFLTKAQDEIIKNHFTATSNSKNQGFDDNFKRQSEFAPLIKVVKVNPVNQGSIEKIDQRSRLYWFPTDYFLSVNEEIHEATSDPELFYQYVVNPIHYTEYKRLMLKPYQYPVKKTAWRLINGIHTNTAAQQSCLCVELIGNFHENTTLTYRLRYVKQPVPIILANLTEGEYAGQNLSIKGRTTQSMCELGADVFNEVLQRAVELAKNAWEGDVTSTKTFGERSE